MKLKNLVRTALLVISFILGVAQIQAAQDVSPLVGSWEAALRINRSDLRIALTIVMEQGELKARLISDGLGVYGLPADSLEIDGNRISLKFSRLDAEVSGWLRFNDSEDQVIRIDGDWFQGAELVPMVLVPVSEPNL